MTRAIRSLAAVGLMWAAGSCAAPPEFVIPPIETRLLFLNLSERHYAALRFREHTGDLQAPFATTPLMAPGAGYRESFPELLDSGCPDALDLQILLYRRVNEGVAIGLDEGEAVDPVPAVAGEFIGIPACSVAALESFTIVNWNADEGTARVKLAQDTAIDAEIRRLGLFDEPDAAWEVVGVDPALGGVGPPALADAGDIGGRVTRVDGSGVEGVGVLMRTRIRSRLDDADTTNDPDSGFSGPIGFATTDADGAFSFDRPPGAYLVEFFSDEFAFRPPEVFIESPIERIVVVAEPIE
ncbi:MAG: carboxypeptidase regulatory-like domain-containing protein [Phycisphaerales bacterium]|nr:carboxypeptidase regulatory-like domain-containing protein [Phycisphaerales bacterium]